ncbi:hypothetical protein HMN09_01229400 [Mycena chlorophos]|uniref:Uncharacterized protein n=1 Tax=Mycena chlorophos TaxID=658473 RepID=A0A8H6S487_MYCCL|nr:hypothetical protein HMN09_01229400 [Mycena chlorophos]
MSHLTASPFHKPSPFQFPQRTNPMDGSPQLPTPASMSTVGGAQDAQGQTQEYFDTPSVAPEGPASRFRRAASSIVYHNSGLRESRERTVQRSSRSFIVVLPPPSLPQDHGHLGHTLSSGPRNRLSQGLLMPLFPTVRFPLLARLPECSLPANAQMYGQLTAIAREYNFPSTTGLCLYLHINENGITATPRISDDSWQMIWSHVFEGAPQMGPMHLPVCGKVEFDIDLRVARWYSSWMAASHREHVDVPMSVTPSAPPSVVHYREESRTTFADGEEEIVRPRHIPRKLSLVDRFDTMSARSVPRSVTARALPEGLPISQNLSPIFQEEEPKTAKFNDLEHRVNSWRASASLLPEAAAAHILLASVISPPLEEESPVTGTHDDEPAEEEYRIEDFSFSISSAGPDDYDPYSPLTWYYDPSIHMAHRAQGSVCMTPTECTSFGPSDYTLSPRHYEFDREQLVYTPDIAYRMFEDVPPSPSEATSWGAPLSYPPTPVSEYRPPSVHLADRGEYSRPTTPMTATSWGAPESFPPSPTTYSYVHTPNIGERAVDFGLLASAAWSIVWPFHSASDANTSVSVALPPAYPNLGLYPAVYPFNLAEIYPAQTLQGDHVITTQIRAYPFLSTSLYPAVYPFVEPYPAISGTLASSNYLTTVRPVRLAPGPSIYPANLREIYPVSYSSGYVAVQSTAGSINVKLAAGPWIYPSGLSEIYPAVAGVGKVAVASAIVAGAVAVGAVAAGAVAVGAVVARTAAPRAVASPTAAPSAAWRMVWPFHQPQRSSVPVTVALPPAYPHLNLYPAVYPFNLAEIYPSTIFDTDQEISTHVNAYPFLSFQLYPAVYPFVEPYPAISGTFSAVTAGTGPIVVKLAPGPSIYPANLREIYPVSYSSGYVETYFRVAINVKLGAGPSIYPGHLDEIYPAVVSSINVKLGTGPSIYPSHLEEIYPALMFGINVKLGMGPSIYPSHLDEIYPPVVSGINVKLGMGPSIYPSHLDEIYPAVVAGKAISAVAAGAVAGMATITRHVNMAQTLPVRSVAASRAIDISLEAQYPRIELYAAVYPFSLDTIYPSVTLDDQDREVSTMINAYPCLNVCKSYPAVYPNLEPYPAISGAWSVTGFTTGPIVVRLAAGDAVYPSCLLEIYPAVGRTATLASSIVIRQGRYPIFNLYPACYPPVPYPAPECEMQDEIEVVLEPMYPFLSLYRPVYPHLEIYPTRLTMPAARPPPQSRFTRSDLHALLKSAATLPSKTLKTHHQLHLAVFPEGTAVVTPSTQPQKRMNSHLDLHMQVFPDGEVLTPSGTPRPIVVEPIIAEGVVAEAVAAPSPSSRPISRLRSGSVIRNSLPPSPRPVGGRPASIIRPAAPSTIPASPPTDATPRSIARQSIVDRTPPRTSSTASSLARSTSMVLPKSGPTPAPTSLERSASTNGPRPMPRKRDSLVLQRVKAFQMQDGGNTTIQEEERPAMPRPIRKLAS